MQCNNTTPIEVHFSETRECDKDWTPYYAGNITDKSTRAMVAGACQAGRSYDGNDCVEFNGRADCGSRAFYAHQRGIDEKIDMWKMDADELTSRIDLPTRFGNGLINTSELLKTMAEAMSCPPLVGGGYIQQLMEKDTWMGWFRLSMRSKSCSGWFNNTLTADQAIFDTCARMSCVNSWLCSKAHASISLQVRRGRSLTSS